MANIGVGAERRSRIVGYNLSKGNKAVSSSNLPIAIAIFGEANTANQADITFNIGKEVTNAQQAGELYGFGSPLHHFFEIARPNSGGVGGIPTIVFPVAEPGGSAACAKVIAPTGTATANVTHTIVLGGRRFKSGGRYDINVETGDTEVEISGKIYDAISAVLSAPVTVALDSPVTEATLTAKWKGASSNFQVSVDTNGNEAGITYSISTSASGSGVPAVTTALNNVGNRWFPLVANLIGSDSTTLDAFETWNGIASQTDPTGRYVGTTMKPAIVVTGSTADDPSSVTSGRRTQMTNTIAPAPLSKGFAFEAAANYIAVYAPIAQNNPHLGANGKFYPDMPVPADENIGTMKSYNERDRIVKLGCSTVDLVAGRYQIQDSVTTYRPEGEVPPKFSDVRDLIVDYNIRYGYYLLELTYVVDNVIAADDATVRQTNVIKPSRWKQILFGYAQQLEDRALIARKEYMQESITVEIATDNPKRFNTVFGYERTGIVIISSTMAFADFYYGE